MVNRAGRSIQQPGRGRSGFLTLGFQEIKRKPAAAVFGLRISDSPVGGNFVEPGLELQNLGVRQALNRFIGPVESFLSQVGGGFGFPDQAQKVGLDGTPVRLNQLNKSFFADQSGLTDQIAAPQSRIAIP